MEEIKKIEVQGQQYGVADMLMRGVMGGNAQVIEWSHTHNMNDYKEAGTYRIKGERTAHPHIDNLPIMNQGSGHTIEGILYVLDSSLTNGSGKEDDCTVTQFLMLSNRVGGQEGDMYMRSAYGANKDSLTWKPWEKYQTNMEVGCVSDLHLLNPSNPTQVLKQEAGLNYITENGIYSGIYIPARALVNYDKPSEGIYDPTDIETFVMIVINNYQAAGDDRCIMQIKFSVTNGGAFLMEKRKYNKSWLLWETAPNVSTLGNVILIETENSTIKTEGNKLYVYGADKSGQNYSYLGSKAKVSDDTTVGIRTYIGDEVYISGGIKMEWFGILEGLKFGLGNSTTKISMDTTIGKNVTIGEGVNITGERVTAPRGSYYFDFPYAKEEWGIEPMVSLSPRGISGTYFRLTPNMKYGGDSSYFVGIDNRELGEGFRAGGSEYWENDDGSYVDRFYQMFLSKDNIRFRLYEDCEEIEKWTQLPYGLTIEPSEDGSKLLLSYNGKTAELPLT